MSDELLPCPFCGSKDIDVDTINWGWRAMCRTCGTVGIEHKVQGATEAQWNTRPIESALRADLAAAKARVKQLEAELKKIAYISDERVAEATGYYCRGVARRALERQPDPDPALTQALEYASDEALIKFEDDNQSHAASGERP